MFSSTKRDIRALLTSGYYRVPRFQRPYSWTREELEDFWQDTIVEGEAEYFIGSVVAFTESPGLTYTIGAATLSVGLLGLGAWFTLARSTGRARLLFRATLLYLPAVWGLLLLDAAG